MASGCSCKSSFSCTWKESTCQWFVFVIPSKSKEAVLLFCFRPPYIRSPAYPSQAGAGGRPMFSSQHPTYGNTEAPVMHQPGQYQQVAIQTGLAVRPWHFFFLMFMNMPSGSWRNIRTMWKIHTYLHYRGDLVFCYLFTNNTVRVWWKCACLSFTDILHSFWRFASFMPEKEMKKLITKKEWVPPSLPILPATQASSLSPFGDVFASQQGCATSFSWLVNVFVIMVSAVSHSPKAWYLSDVIYCRSDDRIS